MKRFHRICLLVLGLIAVCGASYSAAGTVTYTYDDAGRLIKAGYEGGKSITYTYDNNGNLIQRDSSSQAQQYTLNVRIGPAMAGTVTGPGIQCPGDCTEEYDNGTVIRLTANEATGFRFIGWGGDLSGNTNPCTMTIDADKNVISISIPTR